METITDLQKIVARVEYPANQSLGTAFVLHNDGLLVTCAHVLNNEKVNIKPGEQVYLRFVVDWDTLCLAHVLEDGWMYEDENDIAFLKAEKLPDEAVIAPLLEWRGLSQESSPIPILACGFPIAKDKEIVADGKVVQYRDGLKNNRELLLDAKNVTHGMSGGPVWDSRPGINGVLGMIRQVYTGREVEDLGKAIPCETILRHVPPNWKIATKEAEVIQEYRTSVFRRFEYLDLRDAQWLGDLRLPLDSIYVKLQAVGELPTRDIPFNIELLKTRGVVSQEKGVIAKENIGFTQHPKSPPPPVLVETAISDSLHLVILGEPGSGKSTLLNYLALQFAQEHYQPHINLKAKSLPVHIRLIEYASSVQSSTLSQYIVKKLADQLPEYLVQDYLRNGQCVLLLDALDEIGDDLRRQVADRIDEFLDTPSLGKNRVIITSRIAGYYTVKLQARSIAHYTLCPFQPTEAQEFARKWFNAVTETRKQNNTENAVENLTIRFISEIKESGLDSLMDNPLLLRIAAALYVGSADLTLSGILPNKVSLYQRYVGQLLRHCDQEKNIEPFWVSVKGVDTEEDAALALQEIAWAMHNAQKPLSDRQLTIELQKQLKWTRSTAEDFLLRLRVRTGLLIAYAPANPTEPDENLLAFSHLTFREYFVARYLFSKWISDSEEAWKVIYPIRHRPDLQYSMLLFAGLFGYEKQDGTPLIQKLWQANEEESNELHQIIENILRRDILLAGRCLSEMGGDNISEEVGSAFLDEMINIWNTTHFIRLRNQIMSIIGSTCSEEFRENLANNLVGLLSSEELREVNQAIYWKSMISMMGQEESEEEISVYDIHNAAMCGLGRLGIVNDEVLEAITGALRPYDETPMDSGGRPPDWMMSGFHQIEEDLSALTRFQKSAIESLCLLDAISPDVINSFIEMTKVYSKTIRGTASKALKQLSQKYPEIINKLPRTFNEYWQGTRYFIAEMLAEMAESNSAVIDMLVNLLADEAEDWQKREMAAKSLGDLIDSTKGRVPDKVYEVLIETLESEDYNVVKQAIESLSKALPFENEYLSARVINALISLLISLENADQHEFGSYIATDKLRNEIIGALTDILIIDMPSGTCAAIYHNQSLIPLIRTDSIALKTITVFIAMLFDEYSTSSEMMSIIDRLGKALSIDDHSRIASSIPLVNSYSKKHLNDIRNLLHDSLVKIQKDDVRNISFRLIRVLEGARLFTLYRDGALYDQWLIQDAAHSTELLDSFTFAIYMTFGDANTPSGGPFEHLAERYFDDLERAILSWVQNDPSSEIIEELYSLADKKVGKSPVAIKLLSQIETPPQKVIDLLVSFLSSDDYKLKRSAAIALRKLNATDTEVIEALLDKNNCFSTSIWHSYIEETFIKALARLARNYDKIDDVMEHFHMAANFAPGANLAAVEGFGELGHVTAVSVGSLTQALFNLDIEIRQAAISSLIRLHQLDDEYIILKFLIAACSTFNDYKHPELGAIMLRAQAQESRQAFIFEPHHLPDIHNYAYDALWSVMTGELIDNEVIR